MRNISLGASTSSSEPSIYLISGSYGNSDDLVPDSKTIFRHKLTEAIDIVADFVDSNFWAEVAATAETVFSITKNGVEIATITFSVSGTDGVFSMASDESFAIGDIIRIVSPTQDATLAGIAWTIKGTRS